MPGIFAARAPARRTLQFRECCGLPMVNRYHGTLTPPRIAPSRPFKEKTEVSLYPASASSQAAAPHGCYSSPEVAHSRFGRSWRRKLCCFAEAERSAALNYSVFKEQRSGLIDPFTLQRTSFCRLLSMAAKNFFLSLYNGHF